MKFRTLALPFCILASDSASITSVAADLCLGSCGTNAAGTTKECTFHVKVDMHASEMGYYNFDECEGNNPTLGEYISCCTCWCRIAEMLTACACSICNSISATPGAHSLQFPGVHVLYTIILCIILPPTNNMKVLLTT